MSRPVEVIRHESEFATSETVVAQAAAPLRGLVHGYAAWSSHARGDGARRQLPGLRVPLIFMAQPGFEVVADPPSGAATVVERAFVAGLHGTFSLTRTPGRDGGIQVDLSPLGARVLFGIPMSELSGRAVEVDDALGPEAGRLAERLRETDGREARFAAIDAFLLCRLAAAPKPDPRVAWAYGRIVRSGGAAPIAPLAEAVGWSHRRLIEGFRDGIGLAPKTLARVVRFNRALRLAERNPAATWAEVACSAGYYDQPHLVREFVALSGASPTELAGRILGNGAGVLA